MKILFICPRFDNSGGDSIYASKIASELRKFNIDVIIITIENNKFVLKTNDKSNYFSVSKTIDLNIIAQNYYSFRAKQFIRDALLNIKPDLIHIHGIHQYFTLSVIKELRRYDKPVVMSLHDYKVLCGNAGFFSDRTFKPCIKCLLGRYIPPIYERCKRGSLTLSIATSLQMGIWNIFSGNDVISSYIVGSNFVKNLLSSNNSISKGLNLFLSPHLQITIQKLVW